MRFKLFPESLDVVVSHLLSSCSDAGSIPRLRHRLLPHHHEGHQEAGLRHRPVGRRRHGAGRIRLVGRGTANQHVVTREDAFTLKGQSDSRGPS